MCMDENQTKVNDKVSVSLSKCQERNIYKAKKKMSSFEEKLKKHKSFCCWTGLGIVSHIKARVILLFPLSHKPLLSRLVALVRFLV